MTTIKIDRTKRPPLEFDGEDTAYVSSWEPGKERWTELQLYSVEHGGYVLAVRGCTDVPDEVTYVNAHYCADVDELRYHLGCGNLGQRLLWKAGIDE